jgi:steroid delta-isomerase-like uncharacterized protein
MSANTGRRASDRNRETVLRSYDAANQHDIEAVLQYGADDMVIHDIPEEFGQGKEGMRRFLQTFYQAFPDYHTEVIDMVAEGDLVAAHNRITGTHHGEFLGVPASGRVVEWEDADFARFNDDGKVVEYWNSTDMLSVMQQMGAVPEDIVG